MASMLKNIVTISLMIFIILIVIILGAGVFLNKSGTSNATATNQNTINAVNNVIVPISGAEVAQHNTANNCWTIVNNKVYDVTNLIPIHTGGPDKIILFCGKDATTAFETRDGMGSHSQRAQNILNTYYVGDLSR